MKQKRTTFFVSAILLLAVVLGTSSCRKYAYNENDNYTHCYCVYYSAPGVEVREDIRMRSSSRKIADYNCSVGIQAEMEKKHGGPINGPKNVSCSID